MMTYTTITNSSQISRIGYNAETQEMAILFKNGAEYIYSDVPQSFIDEILSAESCGKYFNSNGRIFKFRKVESDL